jgi:tetratricopeptide (TPR) repeat protein
MSAWDCADFERNVHTHLQDALPPADAVRAQAHLEGCEPCAALTARWDVWSDAIAEHSVPALSKEHAARLTASILIESEQSERAPVRPARRRFVSAVSAGVLALAASLVVVAMVRAPKAIVAPPQPEQPIVVANGKSFAVGQDAMQLGRVTLVSRATARVHVEGAASKRPRVVIESGAVRFDVEPLGKGEELEACTEHTCVRVIGTSFEVARAKAGERDRVSVDHGLVAVYPIGGGGEVLLGAGDVYDAPWSRAAAEAPAPVTIAPSVPARRETPRLLDPIPQSVEAPRPKCPAQANEAAIAKLGKAGLGCVESADPERLLSIAEILLGRGDAAAAELYFAEIIARFPRSMVADNALYSHALVALDAGREYEARERLGRYLSRAPNGAFRADAAWRLATLLARARQLKPAARLLSDVADLSPSSSRRAEALFLLGSICDRELDDRTGALVAYRRAVAEPSAAADIRQAAAARIEELLSR